MVFTHVDPQKIIEIDEYWSREFGQPALRPAARLVLLIAARGPVSVKEAMHDSALSHRAFYNVLDGLKAAGIIKSQIDEADGRVRLISLADSLTGGTFRRLEEGSVVPIRGRR